MTSYRIFFLDSNGRTASKSEVEFHDDAEAVSGVPRMYPDTKLEVWRGCHRLSRFDGCPAVPFAYQFGCPKELAI